MSIIHISYDGGSEARLAKIIVMPKRRYKYLPVVSSDADDLPTRLVLWMGGFYVHKSNFESYIPILRSLDQIADWEDSSVGNVSLSPGPGKFEPREPMNVASRIVASRGHALVFAAGNDGPGAGTISPWSVAPWVIGVGAASVDGAKLLPESSVGVPGDSRLQPTVVGPGETVVPLRDDANEITRHGTMVGLVIIGKDFAGRNLPGCSDVAFRGTSVSAPKVTRICQILLFLLRIVVAVDVYLKTRIAEARSGEADQLARIEKAIASARDAGKIDHPGIGILHGVPVEQLQPIFEMYLQMCRKGADPAEFIRPATVAAPFPTSVLKDLLVAMARPMPGYAPHQVGAGFVDEAVATVWLSSLSSQQAVRILFPRMPSTVTEQWADADRPLFDAGLLVAAKEQIGEKAEMTSFKVLK